MGKRRVLLAATTAATMLVTGCGDASPSGTASSSPATTSPATGRPNATTPPVDGDELFLALESSGAGQWSSQRCPQLTIGFPETSEPVPSASFACSANEPAEPLGGGLDGPVVYASPSDVGEEALAVGTVQLVDGCLYLGASSDSLEPVTLVWKAGTRWDPVTNEVLLPDGTRLPVGTSISAGGGYHPAGAISGFVTDPEALSKVAQCATAGDSDGVFVVQHPVDVEP